VVERGQTLEHVARQYGCTTDAVLRANGLDTTLVPAGTRIRIPRCQRARPAPAPADHATLDDRARRALAVIDGTAVVTRRADHATPVLPEPAPRELREVAPTGEARSIGRPWNGRLENGRAMPRGEGYVLRRPGKAYGAEHVVGHLRRVIAEVRALHPHVHALAIGDLSAPGGGPLDRHRSHQSGVDVDIGLYFTKPPKGYPQQFVAANAELDLQATWALITAFARTADLPTGVQVILLDHAIQARLYRWARARGTPDDQLAELLQYPREPDVAVGLVRHWPSHADHLHVRFKPGG
jgi:murein endopeptidase